jgi:hypothetical protein
MEARLRVMIAKRPAPNRVAKWSLFLAAMVLVIAVWLVARDLKSWPPENGAVFSPAPVAAEHAADALEGKGLELEKPTPGDAISLPEPAAQTRPAQAFPRHSGPLKAQEAHRLLSGKIIFNPNTIPSSGVPVGPTTPIFIGEDLQVKWGETWWAGTITGFEADGRVRIHYFGWADSWDEAKLRTELQLDRGARVRALDSTYVRDGW